MVWNIAPECISTVILSIIWIYSRKGNIAPNLKNKLFQICFLSTLLAMTSNIISTVLIYQLTPITILPAWFCNTIYFIATPLMGTVYHLYVLANIYENKKFSRMAIVISMIPAIIYTCIIFINPWTHWIFNITLQQGYQQGPFISLTYIIFFLYCIICVIFVIWKGKYVDKTVRKILFLFPFVAAMVIVVQLIFPSIILSGSAATIALLMIYLYMQNKQISIDHLTGLANRQEFLNMIDYKIKNKTATFHIITLSLRDFKRINDVYGQHAGDQFLIAIARYLKQELFLNERELYRYSGDEFAIIKENISKEQVQSMLHSISLRMLQPWSADNDHCMLYSAFGIVSYPECADTKEEIINGIDFSINLAKEDRASQHICYCSAEIFHNVRRRQQIVEILRDSLANHTFELYYQPIYSIETKTYTIAEALLRIPQSPFGPIYPDEFIPIAEECGLIVEITYHVLDEVCHTIQQLKREEIALSNINVNFSTLQFVQPDLIEKVIHILKEHVVEGSCIKIEITEGTLSDNVDVMMDYAHQMQTYGIQLAIDDFGTGYSNMESVITLPVDMIKFDKSLIWAAMENERSALVVKNLSRTFLELGFIVLAEGVETIEQSKFVEACGCSLIQGYLYSKPLPKDQFIAFLKDQAVSK